MWWMSVAAAISAGPEDDLQALVDDPSVQSLELRSGVYDQALVLSKDGFVVQAAFGAVPVFAVFGNTERRALFEVHGREVGLFGLTLAPTNLDAVVVDGGQVHVEDVRIQTSGVGRALAFDAPYRSTLTRLSVFGGLSGTGGQVLLEDGELSVTDSAFDDGNGTEGGSIFTAVGTTLELSDVVLRGHRATEGGALSCHGACALVDTLLEDNQAQIAGGAVLVAQTGSTVLERVEVFHNEAVEGAGMVNHGRATVLRSTFCANDAGTDGFGGGISSVGGEGLDVQFARFLHNQAGTGGAMQIRPTLVPAPAVVRYVNLLGNRGIVSGAALDGQARLEASWVGLSEGAPALSAEVEVASSSFFSNASGAHPTQTFLEVPDPMRGYAPGEVCGLYRDVYAPGSGPVEATVPATQREPGAIGAYATDDGIAWGRVDADEDGWIRLYDCDDERAAVFPKNPEEVYYNGSDENCDGQSDDDQDEDGYDDEARGGEDCNDNDNRIHPGALDLDPTVDANCNGVLEDQATDLVPGLACSAAPGPSGVPLTVLGFLVWAMRRGVTGSPGRRNREHPHPE